MITQPNSMIHLREVSFGYAPHGLRSPALDAVDLEVLEGDFMGIIGPNGGGKSTLMKLILGLQKPQHGHISVMGQSPRQARRRVGYVPQHQRIDPEAPATAMDVVLSGCLSGSPWGVFFGGKYRKAALQAMERSGCVDLAKRPIAAMSGGQRQRVMIARALVNEPELVLMDEPTTGIDARTEEKLAELLSELNHEVTLMVVTHDLGFLTGRITRVACLNRRISCFHVHDMDESKIQQLYLENTHALLTRHGYSYETNPVESTDHGEHANCEVCGVEHHHDENMVKGDNGAGEGQSP